MLDKFANLASQLRVSGSDDHQIHSIVHLQLTERPAGPIQQVIGSAETSNEKCRTPRHSFTLQIEINQALDESMHDKTRIAELHCI